MTTMKSSSSKTYTVTEAKKHFLDLVEHIGETNDSITITRNGIPTTVMISLDDYESLQETLEILADPKIIKALQTSQKQKKRGQLVDDEDVWA
jgi:antitoxin YefM